MNKSHFKIILRPDQKTKDGLQALYLYAYINGVKKYFSLNKSVLPKHWNEKKQEVYLICPDWLVINTLIKDYLGKAESVVKQANYENEVIKLSEFDRLFRGVRFDHNNIIAFIENDIKEFSSKFTYGTIQVYKTVSNKIEAFQKDVSFQELTPFWWRRFENNLIEKGNNKNTIHKTYRTLKTFIHRAIEQGIIKDNPLKTVKVEKAPGKLLFLTLDELNKLEKLYSGFLTPEYKRTLQYFLFACFTGLRFSDMQGLKFKHIFEGQYIEKEIFKTKEVNRIPLSERAKKLIPKMGFIEKPVFDVYCNQVTNRHLKDIMKLAKIEKRISFHCARHTFGTNTYELSGDISGTQKLMGHAKIETTLIYAKVSEAHKKDIIDKWNTV
jgi:site-specific recombinase XerD